MNLDNHLIGVVGISFVINLIFWSLVTFYSFYKFKLKLYHVFSLFLIYHFIGYVVRPLTILVNNGSFAWRKIDYVPTQLDLINTTIIVNLGLFSVFAGFLAFNKSRAIHPITSFNFEIKRIKNFYFALSVIVLLGIYSLWKVTPNLEDSSNVLSNIETEFDDQGAQRLVGVSGYQIIFNEFLPITILMLFFSRITMPLGWILFLTYSAMRIFLGFQRLSFVVIAICLTVYSYIKEKKIKGYQILFGLIMLTIFNILGENRLALRHFLLGGDKIEKKQVLFDDIGKNYGTEHFAEFDVCVFYTSVGSKGNWSYWRQWLRLFIWPIPRFLWKDKPVLTHGVDFYKYGKPLGMTRGYYAYAYSSYGYISLILAAFIFGLFMAYVYPVDAFGRIKLKKLMLYWIVLMYSPTLFRDNEVTVFFFWIPSVIASFALLRAGRVGLVYEKI
jgi:hypothetical protein